MEQGVAVLEPTALLVRVQERELSGLDTQNPNNQKMIYYNKLV